MSAPTLKTILIILNPLIKITGTCPRSEVANTKKPYFAISIFQLKECFAKAIITTAKRPTAKPIGRPNGDNGTNNNPATARDAELKRSKQL